MQINRVRVIRPIRLLIAATVGLFIGGFLLSWLRFFSFDKFLFQAPCYKCNIIVIVIDPLRADELPCYGYNRNTAPNICSFAKKNILFPQSYSQSSWTLPSIMSFMTSVYPSKHGLFKPSQDVLPVNLKTLPQVLQDHGYQTIYAGETDDDHIPMTKGFGRGFETIIDNSPIEDWAPIVQEKLTSSSSTPSFLYLHSFALRWAYAYPPDTFQFDPTFSPPFSLDPAGFSQDMWKESLPIIAASWTGSAQQAHTIAQIREAKTFEEAKVYFYKLPEDTQKRVIASYRYNLLNPTNSSHMQYLKNIYDNQLYKTDNRMKPLLELLSTPAIANRTIVIFTSNHGDEFGEHGLIGHGRNLYATVTHVPLAMSIPGLTSRVINSIVQSIDIYPTILSLTHVPISSSLDGKNFVGLLQRKQPLEDTLYAFGQLGPTSLSSVRTTQWSYYVDRNPDHPMEELYNLQDDPQEQNNLMPSHPTIKDTLKKTLETIQ